MFKWNKTRTKDQYSAGAGSLALRRLSALFKMCPKSSILAYRLAEFKYSLLARLYFKILFFH